MENAYNTSIGKRAGYLLTTGSRNTFIGHGCGEKVTDLDDTVAIGWGAEPREDGDIVFHDVRCGPCLRITKDGDVFVNDEPAGNLPPRTVVAISTACHSIGAGMRELFE